MPTIGQKLEETRLALGLAVEDVAHETRIHPSMILSIEEDDFSRFPSVAYAKSFIRKYGDYLGIDLAETMETLGGGTALAGDKEWMAEAKRPVRKGRRFHWGRLGRRSASRSGKAGGMPLFLNFILVNLMAALGIFYFLGYNAPTPEKAREEIVRGLGLPLPLAEAPGPEAEGVEANPLKSEDAAATSPDRPAIDLPRDEAPAVAAHAPRPRPTPAIGDDLPATPPPLEDLPAVLKAVPEPQAASLPETADPAATTKRETEAAPLPVEGDVPAASGERPGPPPAPQPVLRAVPVAASE